MPKFTRGARYAAAVRAEYELNESQEVLVDEIAATMDVIDGLSPADVREARAQRLLLARMLGQLGLPDVDQDAGRQTATSTRARHAAESRWHQKRAERAAS
jgi:hypothetical protein